MLQKPNSLGLDSVINKLRSTEKDESMSDGSLQNLQAVDVPNPYSTPSSPENMMPESLVDDQLWTV